MKTLLDRWKEPLANMCSPRILTSVQADALTFLEHEALHDLFVSVKECERRKLEGVLIEAGCAAGGSAIVIAAAKHPARPLLVYDVFGMIPPPSEADSDDVWKRYEVIAGGHATGIGNRKYYGYETDLLSQVEESFARHGYPIKSNNVSLLKGLFEDMITGSEPVALAHVDGDWYDSVTVCLERIVPRLVVGGRLVIDDYSAWSGCRKAVDEYFANMRHQYEFVNKSRLHVIRV